MASGVYNVADYGGIQQALNAMPEYGGTCLVPALPPVPDFPNENHWYTIDRPLLLQGQGHRLIGTSGKAYGTRIRTADFFGPAICSTPLRQTIPLAPSLLSGPGHSFVLCGQQWQGYLLLSDADTLRLDGAGALTVEFAFRPDNIGTYSGILQSFGRRSYGDPETWAFGIRQNAGGQLVAILTAGGVKHEFGSQPGVLANGVPFYVALVYDGSRINLWGGSIGGQCTLLASEAASGPLTQPVCEEIVLGHVPVYWPAEGVKYGAAFGLVDGVRISDTARYTAPFPAPAAKLTSDARTRLLLNFDEFLGDGGVLNADNGPMVVGRWNYYGERCFIAWRSVIYGPANSRCTVSDLEVSALGPGLLALYSDQFTIERFWGNNCSTGIWLSDQCFLPHLRDIKLDGWAVTMPSGQLATRAGLMMTTASSGGHLQDFDVTNYPYSLVDSPCAGQIDHFYCTTEPNTVAHLLCRGGGGGSNVLQVNGFFVDDEGGGPSASLEAAMILDRLDLVDVRGGKIELVQSPNPTPMVRIEGGRSLNFLTDFYAGRNVTEVFRVATADLPTPPGVSYGGSVLIKTADRPELPPWRNAA